MTTLSDRTFPAGTVVLGKWNKNRYVVERLLGEGANGRVYLVRNGNRQYAMKVGFDTLDLQSEVNALRALSQDTTASRRYWIETDDFHLDDTDFPFYIMKYVKGRHFSSFLRKEGGDWFYLLGYLLLNRLKELHARGYIFGDLKIDNVLVSGYGQVELIDYGGVTARGRSVKQFTEMYDRGYWNAGSRTADEAYDLFSFSIMCLQAADPERRIMATSKLLPQNRNVEYLLDLMKSIPLPEPIAACLRKALTGQYATSAEACEDWRRKMLQAGVVGKGFADDAARPPVPMGWLQGILFITLLLFASVLYLTLK